MCTCDRAAVEWLRIVHLAAVEGDIDAPAHTLARVVADEALPRGQGQVLVDEGEVGLVEVGYGEGAAPSKLHLEHGPGKKERKNKGKITNFLFCF